MQQDLHHGLLAREIAGCFGCVAGDLFPPASLYPATAVKEAFDASPTEDSRAAG